jgi:hypothetical protein
MQLHLGLDQQARDALTDEQWVEAAATAIWLHESYTHSVRNGVVKAINALFGH